MPAVPAGRDRLRRRQARVWIARPDSKTVVSRADRRSATRPTAWSRCARASRSARPVVTSGTLFIDRAARRD